MGVPMTMVDGGQCGCQAVGVRRAHSCTDGEHPRIPPGVPTIPGGVSVAILEGGKSMGFGWQWAAVQHGHYGFCSKLESQCQQPLTR